MIRKYYNRQQVKPTKTAVIDAYNTLHDEFLACGVTLQDIKFHERLSKDLKTNRPVTASSLVNRYKQLLEPYVSCPNPWGIVQTALVRSHPLIKLR